MGGVSTLFLLRKIEELEKKMEQLQVEKSLFDYTFISFDAVAGISLIIPGTEKFKDYIPVMYSFNQTYEFTYALKWDTGNNRGWIFKATASQSYTIKFYKYPI